MAIVGLVLLIACSNVGNLLLALSARQSSTLKRAVRVRARCAGCVCWYPHLSFFLVESILLGTSILAESAGLARGDMDGSRPLRYSDSGECHTLVPEHHSPTQFEFSASRSAITTSSGLLLSGLSASLGSARVDLLAALKQTARRLSRKAGHAATRFDSLVVAQSSCRAVLLEPAVLFAL